MFLPVLQTPYTYVLLALSGVLAFAVSMLFLFVVDCHRLVYQYQGVAKETVKSIVVSMVTATALISLYDLALYFGITSKFFKQQYASHSRLGVFGVDGGFCTPSTYGQDPLVIQKIITVLFLLLFPLLTTYFVSRVMYQLHNSKEALIYFGLMAGISLSCYVVVMKLSFI